MILDIYDGVDPGDVPAYYLAEASRNLRLPAATVRSWAKGRTYRTKLGSSDFPPLITIADPGRGMLSFRNLIELHTLSAIRRNHHVDLKAVRRAMDLLKNHYSSEHPLLEPGMSTDGKDLFVERYGQLINITQHGQLAMREVMDAYLKRIGRDERGSPVKLYPFTRPSLQEGPAPGFISIDPRVRFGNPCISGTRIPTFIIHERHQAGDSIEILVKDYGRSPEEIEEAIRYESRVAA